MGRVKIEGLEGVAGAEGVHRGLDFAGVVVEAGTATAPAACGAVEKHGLVAENEERRVAAVAADEPSAIRQPTGILRHVAARVAPARAVRGERVQLGKVHLLLLVESSDRQPFARAKVLLRIGWENLRGMDVRRNLHVEKSDDDVRVRDAPVLHEPDRADAAVRTDEEEARLGGEGKVLGEDDVPLADEGSCACRAALRVPGAGAREVDVPRPEARIGAELALRRAGRIADETRQGDGRIGSRKPLVHVADRRRADRRQSYGIGYDHLLHRNSLFPTHPSPRCARG